MPTKPELKQLIRNYKKTHCTAYSRLNKPQLEELIKKLNIDESSKIKTITHKTSKQRLVSMTVEKPDDDSVSLSDDDSLSAFHDVPEGDVPQEIEAIEESRGLGRKDSIKDRLEALASKKKKASGPVNILFARSNKK